MKKIISLSLLILICFVNGVGQNTGDTQPEKKKYVFVNPDSVCPTEGNPQSQRMRDLNKLKNRTATPAESDFDNSISLEKILQPGDDRKRWSTNKAARIKGYVYDVKSGGKETCNCKAEESFLRDTHIEIILDPMDDTKSKRFIIEVNPRLRDEMRKKGINWSTKALRDKFLGRWVLVEGWMFFDEEHDTQSENTNPKNQSNWRATAWELHPITKLEVTERPR